jgi:hypothetical protein
MSESSPASAGAASAGADREARIEQLLLSGLDQYFAGQYEQAINIWTRVVFLERGHSRARAYIERARSAMAERQRECEELIHRGVDAYNAGDVTKARALLTEAVDQGGPSDTALLFLDRLSRVSATPLLDVARVPPARATIAPPVHVAPRSGWFATIAVSAVVATVLVLGVLSLVSWFTDPAMSPAAAPERLAPEPLPIVRPSEILIDRARQLYVGGRLRDALRTLDRIDAADPMRPDADRLRADVQRALLSLATNPAAFAMEDRR